MTQFHIFEPFVHYNYVKQCCMISKIISINVSMIDHVIVHICIFLVFYVDCSRFCVELIVSLAK